ncbi:MAG TPA: hypothetical protein VLJ62_23095 [Burkholderiaceae bacterium]|nr:hypothetical protein [Burkholderiaceae bacterium]
MKQPTRRCQPALRAAGLICLCLFGRGAHAESTPFRLGAGVAYDSDDNVFRAPAGQEVSDRYTTLSVFGGIDETESRQRVQGKLKVSRILFQERQDLDHTGGDGLLRWTGETAGPISWDLGYVGRRGLTSYATVVDPQQRVPNVETSQQASAGFQLGMQAQWVAGLNLSHRRIDETAAEFKTDELRLNSAGLNVLWNPLGPVSVSVGPRFSHGRYPLAREVAPGVFQADEFDRGDLDVGLKWVPSGASTLNARLSLTRQTFDVFEDRDFEGATGLISWTWQATDKTKFQAVLTRDTGSETSFFRSDVLGSSQRGTSDSSQYTSIVAARVDYEATAKVSLGLSGAFAKRHLTSSSSFDGSASVGESGNERSSRVALAVRYAPTRNALIACDVGQERRSTDSDLSSSYRATIAGCAAQLAVDL